MFNYLSGEFYKLRKHKSLYIGVGLLVALECVIFLPNYWYGEDAAFKQGLLLAFFDAALFVGLFIAPIFAVLVFDDQHGNDTLKNEIVFGIPRSRIYFGKLAAGWAVGTLSALLVAGVYLMLALLLSRSDGNTAALLWGAFISFGGHWLTWLSIYSFTFFLLMFLKSATAAVGLVYITTLIGFPFSTMGFSAGEIAPWLRLACQLFYTAPLTFLMEGELVLGVTVTGETRQVVSVMELVGKIAGGNLRYSLGVCLLWTVGLSLVGLFLFTRREIK